MIDTHENAQIVVDLLNDIYKTDPDATRKLFTTRVQCNQALADHSHVIVKPLDDGKYDVGFLGIINALFGASHRVGIKVDTFDSETKDAEVFKFVRVFEVVEAYES